jgi:hypothetical protein
LYAKGSGLVLLQVESVASTKTEPPSLEKSNIQHSLITTDLKILPKNPLYGHVLEGETDG